MVTPYGVLVFPGGTEIGLEVRDLASAFAVYMSSPCLLAAPAVSLAAGDTSSTPTPSISRRIPYLLSC